MKSPKSPTNQSLIQKFTSDLGDVFIYKNFVIAEFKYGVDINFENFYEISLLIQQNFGKNPFGFIANRINSYSINLSDAELFNEAFPNCKAYAVVCYNDVANKVFEVENRFFTFNRKSFKNLLDAKSWVMDSLNSLV